MKALIIAALIVTPTVSHAESWYVSSKGGGQIIITDKPCYLNGEAYDALKSGYTRAPTGETIASCWYYSDGMVRMVYEDRTLYTYPATSFKKLSD